MKEIDVIQNIIDALDALTGGEQLTDKQEILNEKTAKAASFAAAAYEAHPGGGGEIFALTRSFLLAFVDPLHPDLDYLRADPKSGDLARSQNKSR